MRQRPGGAEGIGRGQPGLAAAVGQAGEDPPGQGRLAAEKVLQAGDVQQEAVRPRGIFHAHDRAELPAPRGPLSHAAAALVRVVFGNRAGK